MIVTTRSRLSVSPVFRILFINLLECCVQITGPFTGGQTKNNKNLPEKVSQTYKKSLSLLDHVNPPVHQLKEIRVQSEEGDHPGGYEDKCLRALF